MNRGRKCFCDICGKEGAKAYNTITYRTFDSTDGRSHFYPPQVRQEIIDLCDECAVKSTNIQNVGVQCDEYKIKGVSTVDQTQKQIEMVIKELNDDPEPSFDSCYNAIKEIIKAMGIEVSVDGRD